MVEHGENAGVQSHLGFAGWPIFRGPNYTHLLWKLKKTVVISVGSTWLYRLYRLYTLRVRGNLGVSRSQVKTAQETGRWSICWWSLGQIPGSNLAIVCLFFFKRTKQIAPVYGNFRRKRDEAVDESQHWAPTKKCLDVVEWSKIQVGSGGRFCRDHATQAHFKGRQETQPGLWCDAYRQGLFFHCPKSNTFCCPMGWMCPGCNIYITAQLPSGKLT